MGRRGLSFVSVVIASACATNGTNSGNTTAPVVEVVPVEVPPDPGPPGLRVLEKGAAPRQVMCPRGSGAQGLTGSEVSTQETLQETVTVGLTTVAAMTVAGMALPTLTVPQAVMILQLDSTMVPTGQKISGKVISIESTPQSDGRRDVGAVPLWEGFKERLNGLVGATGQLELDDDGKLSLQSAELGGMWDVVAQGLLPFPATPIGTGARWQVVGEILFEDSLVVVQRAEFSLAKTDSDTFEVELAIERWLVPGGQRDFKIGAMPVNAASFHGTVRGRLTGTCSRRSPVQGTIVFVSELLATRPEAKDEKVSLSVETRATFF